MVDINQLREYSKAIDEDGEKINQLVREMIGEDMKRLDNLIEDINEIIEKIEDGNLEQISDYDLERGMLQIPQYIYAVNDKIEEIATKMEIAKGNHSNRYNDVYLRVSGTIPEKKAKAEEEVSKEKIMYDVYQRAYRQLRSKVESAERVNSGLKKIVSKRMIDVQVFRGEIG